MSDVDAALRVEDVYRFLGCDLGVRSNSEQALDHVRRMYGRFFRERVATDSQANGRPCLLITDDLDRTGELTLHDGHYLYRLTRTHEFPQFLCQDIETQDVDAMGFIEPLTLIQSALLRTVADHAPRYHVFHAGAVSYHDQGILLVAPSGMGKTTLTLNLVKHGCRFLSDEAACVNPETGTVEPFPRSVNIRSNARALLDLALPKEGIARPVRENDWEWSLDIEDILPGSLGVACPVRWLIFLNGFGDAARWEPLAPSNALFQLMRASTSSLKDASRLLFRFAPLLDRLECGNLLVGEPEATVRLIMDLAGPGTDGRG